MATRTLRGRRSSPWHGRPRSRVLPGAVGRLRAGGAGVAGGWAAWSVPGPLARGGLGGGGTWQLGFCPGPGAGSRPAHTSKGTCGERAVTQAVGAKGRRPAPGAGQPQPAVFLCRRRPFPVGNDRPSPRTSRRGPTAAGQPITPRPARCPRLGLVPTGRLPHHGAGSPLAGVPRQCRRWPRRPRRTRARVCRLHCPWELRPSRLSRVGVAPAAHTWICRILGGHVSASKGTAENACGNDTSDKGLTSKTYKELTPPHRGQTHNPAQKRAQDLQDPTPKWPSEGPGT